MENIRVNILNEILLKYTGCDFSTKIDKLDMKLTGKEFGVPAREMVLLLLEIEDKLNVKIPEDFVLSGKFNSYNNIKNIIIKD